jgi:hypothetical protein
MSSSSPRSTPERAITLFDYEAKQAKELSFHKNELIEVVDKRGKPHKFRLFFYFVYSAAVCAGVI